MPDLEMLDTVEFVLFLTSFGPVEPISTECKISRPVAFLGEGGVDLVRYGSLLILGRYPNLLLQKKPQHKKICIRLKMALESLNQ